MSEDVEMQAVESAVSISVPAIWVTTAEAAKILSMSESVFRLCADHYKHQPEIRQNRFTRWCPVKLRLLANKIAQGGIPKLKK